MNQTAEEGLRTAFMVDRYLSNFKNELQASDNLFDLPVGSTKLFKNLNDEPRCTLHNHRVPSNTMYGYVLFIAPSIIQQHAHLHYPYTFTTAFPTTLGDMVRARMYA